MAIPDYQSITLPLLRLAGDNQPHLIRDAADALAKQFGLSEGERSALLPSGRQTIFDNRVGWAKTYMKKAGLLDSPRRGTFQITQRGLDLLKSNPPRIDIGVLEGFPEFNSFRAIRRERGVDEPAGEPQRAARRRRRWRMPTRAFAPTWRQSC